MIKGFFFDLDGTLVNTYEADFRAYRDAINEVAGITVEQEGFYKTNGLEMRKKLDLLAPGLSEDEIQAVGAAKKRHYQKYLHLTHANTELISFLENFSADHKIVLVTTAKRDNALSVLREHGLEQHFSEMVFGDEVSKPKPDPEPYLIALERSGLTAAEVVAFEDSETGIAAAEAAGIAVIRVKEFAI